MRRLRPEQGVGEVVLGEGNTGAGIYPQIEGVDDGEERVSAGGMGRMIGAIRRREEREREKEVR